MNPPDENANPYAAPAAMPLPAFPADAGAVIARPIPASAGRRFSNFLIDRVVIFCMSYPFGMLLGIVLGVMAPGEPISISKMEELAFGYFLSLVYYIFMEGVTGTTVGKLVTGTKIVNEQGERPSFGTMALRSLCRIIPFEPLSFLGSETRGWHDSMTKTWVVRRESSK
ncbi:RDD family protein [Luteolibacter sp. Populi]|uniref:RDD family protein n=1 Tax=Luteolibacter sp. Populi TaxID=3230487 RepID=UPI0034661C03